MYPEILSKIKTKQKAQELAEELEVLKNSLYESGGIYFEDTLKTKIRAWAAELIRQQIGKEESKEKYLNGLIERLKSARTIKLVLAFEPSEIAIERFHSLISQKTGEVVLDITCNRNILGGAIIIYEGEYRNFSLGRVFEEEFNNLGDSILEMLAK